MLPDGSLSFICHIQSPQSSGSPSQSPSSPFVSCSPPLQLWLRSHQLTRPGCQSPLLLSQPTSSYHHIVSSSKIQCFTIFDDWKSPLTNPSYKPTIKHSSKPPSTPYFPTIHHHSGQASHCPKHSQAWALSAPK